MKRKVKYKKYNFGGPTDPVLPSSLAPTALMPLSSLYVAPTPLMPIAPEYATTYQSTLSPAVRPAVVRFNPGNEEPSSHSKSKDRFREKSSGGSLKYAGGGGIDPISIAISQGTKAFADYKDAFTYKPTLGPDKNGPDWSKAIGPTGIAAMIPELIRWNKDKNTVVSGSPGSYASGGDMSLSNSAFQVQGNANVTDGNKYNYKGTKVALDDDEVVRTDKDFVFTDKDFSLLSGNTFAEDAAVLQKSTGNAEKMITKYGSTEAQNTIKYNERMTKDLASLQELMAAVKGKRNPDGSTKQKMATGGSFWPDPYRDIIQPFDMLPTTNLQLQQQELPYAQGNMLAPAVPYEERNFSAVNPNPTPAPSITPEFKQFAQAAAATSSANYANSQSPAAEGSGIMGRFSLGDAMQFAEVGSKFFGLNGRPERERPYFDITPLTRQTYDVQPALYQNQRNYQNATAGISTPSINLRRMLTNKLYATKLNSDQQVISEYNRMNQTGLSNFQGQVSNRQRYNNQQQVMTNDMNARNRGQYDQAVQNAFNSVGNLGEALNRKQGNQQRLELLRELYPEIYDRIISRMENKGG